MFMRFFNRLYRAKNQVARAITVEASPFTYQNTSGSDESIVVIGGTVSEVAVSRDGTTFFAVAVAASTAGMIHLCDGDRVKVTYSGDPTMECIPG